MSRTTKRGKGKNQIEDMAKGDTNREKRLKQLIWKLRLKKSMKCLMSIIIENFNFSIFNL